jgi:hypothetical protein
MLTEPGRFCPERIFCKLVYTDPVMSRGDVGNDTANWYYQSSLTDPDPNNTGEGLPGFVELANLYQFYRVHSIKADVTTYNQNQEAMILACWPSNDFNNVNSLTHQDILELSSNPQCKSVMCGATSGQGKAKVTTLVSAKKLVGPQFATDLDYASSTSGSPSKLFYLNVGICNCVGNFAYNAVFRTRLIYEVEFFRPRTLMT